MTMSLTAQEHSHERRRDEILGTEIILHPAVTPLDWAGTRAVYIPSQVPCYQVVSDSVRCPHPLRFSSDAMETSKAGGWVWCADSLGTTSIAHWGNLALN